MHFCILGWLREIKIWNYFAQSNISLSHARYICYIQYNDTIHHTIQRDYEYHLLISICRTLKEFLWKFTIRYQFKYSTFLVSFNRDSILSLNLMYELRMEKLDVQQDAENCFNRNFKLYAVGWKVSNPIFCARILL